MSISMILFEEIRTVNLAKVIVSVLVICPLIVNGIEDSSESSLREVQASEILANIQKGEPVEYDHIVVKGKLNLSQLRLEQANVTSPIRINDSTFSDLVILPIAVQEAEDSEKNNMKIVKASEILAKIQKGEPIKCDHIVVKEDLDLSQLRLKQANIASSIRITNSMFDGLVSFRGSTFNRSTDFSGSRFGGYTEFINSTFIMDVIFDGSTFNEDAYFEGSTFNEDAYFEGSAFNSNAYFKESVFNEDAYFEGSAFNRNAYFKESVFNGDVSFNGATFNGDVSFNEATFNGDDYFEGSAFRGYFFGWTDVKNSLIFDEPTYLGLIKNFKDHGRFDDADDCYNEYRWGKMARSKGFGFFWDVLSWITCGYGIRWMNTIGLAILIMFIFGLMFSRDVQWDLKEALSISAIVLLSLPMEWHRLKRDTYPNFMNNHIYYVTFERLIGWSLLLILINTLSRVMIRY